MPPSPEELEEQEADYVIWEQHRQAIMGQFSSGSQPTQPQQGAEAEPKTEQPKAQEQQSPSARGSGTMGVGSWLTLFVLSSCVLTFAGWIYYSTKGVLH